MFNWLDTASMLMSSGGTIDGDVVSISKISCSIVAIFPASSDTNHVTTVEPNSNVDGASLLVETTPMLSSAMTTSSSTIL